MAKGLADPDIVHCAKRLLLTAELHERDACPAASVAHLHVDRGSHGRCVPLISRVSGNTLGVALRPASAKNPIYISVGHRVGLETALELVWSCCR